MAYPSLLHLHFEGLIVRPEREQKLQIAARVLQLQRNKLLIRVSGDKLLMLSFIFFSCYKYLKKKLFQSPEVRTKLHPSLGVYSQRSFSLNLRNVSS